MVLKPEAFQQCFHQWAQSTFPVSPDGKSRIVAIDGKTCRGSHDASKGLGSLHIVSAWASEEGISLGQVATSEKSNEITAIPELLEQIDLSNAIVTIDAMGCQKAIVEKIVSTGGDYVIAVKDNQPKLSQEIASLFREAIRTDFEEIQYHYSEVCDQGHGRSDIRSYYLIKTPNDFALKSEWPSIRALGYSLRETRHDNGQITTDIRYYISSRFMSSKRFGEAVRGHWGIEAMHWVLDVNFREDDCRTRERTLGNNLSWLRRYAVGLLKAHPIKDSISGKMVRCGISTDFLTEILLNQRI